MSVCRGFEHEQHEVDEELPTHGMYAKLCAACRVRRADTQRGPRSKSGSSGELGIDDSTFEGKAKALVSVGRRVDRAIADVKKAEVQRNEVRRLCREALEAWKQTCARLAGAGDRSA